MIEPLTDEQFLKRIGQPYSSASLQTIRLFRTVLAEFSNTRLDPQFIHPSHRVETDLGIHHLDSLDLVDFATEIETDHLRLQTKHFLQIQELNRRNGTVMELAAIVFSASQKPEQGP